MKANPDTVEQLRQLAERVQAALAATIASYAYGTALAEEKHDSRIQKQAELDHRADIGRIFGLAHSLFNGVDDYLGELCKD